MTDLYLSLERRMLELDDPRLSTEAEMTIHIKWSAMALVAGGVGLAVFGLIVGVIYMAWRLRP